MPLNRDRRQHESRLERVLLTLVLTLGSGWSMYALARGLAHRVPLSIVWGGWTWALLAATALSVLLGALAIARLVLRPSGTGRSTPTGWAGDLFCILVLGAVLYVAFAQPFATLTFQFGLGLCSGLFAARVLAGRRRLPRPAGMILFNLCFLIVLAELGLRVYASIWPSPLLSPIVAGVVEHIEAHRTPPGKLRWGFPINSSGHYDEEFLPRIERTGPTIAMLGDSFSAGIVPHAFHFTTVCEQLLEPMQVYNFGVGAIGPIHYEHLLRTEIMPLEPDLVVLNLFVGNDLMRHLEGAPGGLRNWFDRDSVRLVLLPQRLAALRREQRRQDATPAGVAKPQDEDMLSEDWDGDLDVLRRQLPWVDDYALERQSFSRQQFLEIETRRARKVCGSGVAGFPDLLAVVDRMEDLARATPFAVVLIPDQFQIDDALWNTIMAESSELLDRDRPQRILVKALQRRGIPVLDLAPILRAVAEEPDGSRHLYHLRDTHFNARGNQVVGEAMARFIPPLLD